MNGGCGGTSRTKSPRCVEALRPLRTYKMRKKRMETLRLKRRMRERRRSISATPANKHTPARPALPQGRRFDPYDDPRASGKIRVVSLRTHCQHTQLVARAGKRYCLLPGEKTKCKTLMKVENKTEAVFKNTKAEQQLYSEITASHNTTASGSVRKPDKKEKMCCLCWEKEPAI